MATQTSRYQRGFASVLQLLQTVYLHHLQTGLRPVHGRPHTQDRLIAHLSYHRTAPRMADQNDWPILQCDDSLRGRCIVSQRGQRILHRNYVITFALRNRNDLRPTRPVRECSMGLGLRRRSSTFCTPYPFALSVNATTVSFTSLHHGRHITTQVPSLQNTSP